MKQFKRVLALVLVAATLCSFALAAAPTATVKYTDASSIKHTEAVDVLSALGVIQGYKNGSFKPNATVTRAEMAKMLAVLLNKGIDPGESFTDACVFTDAADHWGRTYIGFCVGEGLINGKSATKFDPDGKVTGVEAAKMLLGALGYKAAIHGLTGPQWEANTVGLAMRPGCELFKGIANEAIYKSLSRDDACQVMLNALKADTVDCSYQEGSVPLLDGSGITTSAMNHVHSTIANAITADYRQGGSPDSTEQLCERLFPSLKLLVNTATNVDGHPASQWNNAGKTLGVYQVLAPISTNDSTHTAANVLGKISTKYPQKVLVTYNGMAQDAGKTFQSVPLPDGSCSMAQLKQMLQNAGVISNATAMSDAAFAGNIKSGNATSINKAVGGCDSASFYVQLLREENEYAKSYATNGSTGKYLGWNGVHSEAFYDEATETVTYAAQPLYCVKVTSYRPAVLDDEGNELQKAYVLAKPLNGTPGNNMAPLYLNDTDTIPSSVSAIAIDPAVLDDPESVEKDTCLAVQFGYDSEENGYTVTTGAIMEIVNITVDRISASGADNVSHVRFGKTNYYRAALTPNTQNQFVIGQSKTLYTVAGSSSILFLFFEDGNTAAADYLYMVGGGVAKDPLSEKPYSAGVVNMKGEQSVLTTDKNYGVLGENLTGNFVTTTKNQNDSYALSSVGISGAGKVDIRSGQSVITINECNTLSGLPTGNVLSLAADDKTMFLVELPDANGKATYTSYTGVKNVPTLTTDGNYSYYAYSVGENGHLTALFVGHNLVKTAAATGDYGALFITGEEIKQVIENNVSYYPIAAIVNGKEETLKVDANFKENILGSGYRGFYLFNSSTTNEFGIVDDFDPTSGYAFSALTTPPTAGVIGMDSSYLTYTANSLCYTYSVGQKRLSASTVDAVYSLNNTNPAYRSFYTVNQEYPNILATLAAVID